MVTEPSGLVRCKVQTQMPCSAVRCPKNTNAVHWCVMLRNTFFLMLWSLTSRSLWPVICPPWWWGPKQRSVYVLPWCSYTRVLGVCWNEAFGQDGNALYYMEHYNMHLGFCNFSSWTPPTAQWFMNLRKFPLNKYPQWKTDRGKLNFIHGVLGINRHKEK